MVEGKKQGHFQRMSAISWELSLATFIPLQLRRKGRCVGLTGDRKWSGERVVTECVCLCASWGEGVQGAVHQRRFFFPSLLQGFPVEAFG